MKTLISTLTPNADTKEFWNGCSNHKLTFQKCKSCGHVRWPASILCPKCYSKDTEYIIATGKGKVYSFVIYHVAFNDAFNNKIPYVVAVVKLDEGPHILTNIVDCDFSTLECEMPVEVVWDDVGEVSLPKFKLIKSKI